LFDTPVRIVVVSMPSTTQRFSEALEPSIIWPPPLLSSLTPGADVITSLKLRPLGMRSMISSGTTSVAAFCLTSMSGDSALTETVSATAATPSVRLTLSSCPSSSATLSAFAGVKP
jgi:hypothetical protein